MRKQSTDSIFKTDRRLRLGIWGLGRGLSFYRVCSALNFDVVAGCDFNEHMRKRFLEAQPNALATADAEEFLAQDFDAVLLATFCPAHAGDTIRCLRAGKHVLSEVTAFHTLAEGVALVEAVERSGRVYNLAENYPFTKPNLYLAAKWHQGLFGELMYAEYEYVHECRSLSYTYIDGVPVQPGNTPHNWRSWLNFHYYNTHSLGPMMHITGTRPTRVVALPCRQRLAGYLVEAPRVGMGGIAPSLITMSNGGLVRNLMGATTNDVHTQRLWGTRGAAEIHGGLFLRLGGAGQAPMLEVTPEWPELGKFADTMGHGGGDFWTLYYFARQILTGRPAFFDVYTAADVTIPGILALRSSLDNGKAYNVPDFRDPHQRAKFHHDHFAQKRYNVKRGCFAKDADPAVTAQFTTVMKDLIPGAVLCRSLQDWSSVADDVKDKAKVVALADRFIAEQPRLRQTFTAARKIVAAAPGSDGARVLQEMLDLAGADTVLQSGFRARTKRLRDRLQRATH